MMNPESYFVAPSSELIEFKKNTRLPVPSLHNVPFISCEDSGRLSCTAAYERHTIEEPAEASINSVGLILIEPDFRVWIRKKIKSNSGYKYTFIRGCRQQYPGDKKITLQQLVHKTLLEETGLTCELVHYLKDISGYFGLTRYYIGRRIGGSPVNYRDDTEKMLLMPISRLKDYLTYNMFNDSLVADLLYLKFSEYTHRFRQCA